MRRMARSNPRTALLLAACVAILLWAKLKLVTAIPRSVYADPSAKGAVGPGVANGKGVPADADAPAETSR